MTAPALTVDQVAALEKGIEVCTIPAGTTLTEADMRNLYAFAMHRLRHPEILSAHYDPRNPGVIHSTAVAPDVTVTIGIVEK